jgi:DNA mismatch repair protein MutS
VLESTLNRPLFKGQMTPTRLKLGGATLPAEAAHRANRQHGKQVNSSSGLDSSNEANETATFRSILFGDDRDAADSVNQGPPEYLRDLNLDQILESIVVGRDEYDLKPYFHAPLATIEAIDFRHAVFRDLEAPALFDGIYGFAKAMQQMRASIAKAEKLYNKYQKSALFLNAVELYCSAASRLADDCSLAICESRGFRGLNNYLAGYTRSDDFQKLGSEAESLRSDLNSIRYSLHIDGKRVTVRRGEEEPDFSAEVLRIFEKFRQGTSRQYQFRVSDWPEINHIEAAILDRVARLYPEPFSRLEEFRERYNGFLDPVIATFDREVAFYLAYIEFKRRMERACLRFCYPTIARSKDIHADDTFDLALADKLIETHRPIVTNSFRLRDQERIFVVSGPNQSGKTTFARNFGQLHYLGCLGCPVPGKSAKLFLFDRLFTHFERQEELENLRGKLEDELKRVHSILEIATGKSILIMNESFLSTTLNDALSLSKKIMERVLSLDMLCVTVTFLDELASLNDSTVSMVSTVDRNDAALQTFQIVRKPADGLAYAAAIARKYQLTYEDVIERISGKRQAR